VHPGRRLLRVLILGGTAEARALAEALVGRAEVLTSLAGAVAAPVRPPGEVRVGGFGGAAGLSAFLASWRPDVVVDATHPFAAQITAHAVEAVTDVPLVVLQRPPWSPVPGDDWRSVPSVGAAAIAVRAMPEGCVFLTTGRREIAAFAQDHEHHYLVRCVSAPSGAVPLRTTLLLDRGPYTVDGELAVMTGNGVDVLVCKNSGGSMTAAKLVAARRLGVPVVMVERPPSPAGVLPVADVHSALTRLGVTGA
jgi:precorrin-6A/cobalt-precorrin-6A reductase